MKLLSSLPMKAIKRTAVLMLLASLSPVPSPAETGVTDTEIVLGSCSPLSGPSKDLGTQSLEGARAYLQHVNDSGGVHGRKFKLVNHDDEYSAEKAIGCFKNLMA